MTLADKTISGLLWAFSGSVVQVIIRFFLMIVLARLIGPEDFGLLAAALVAVSFSQIIGQLGLGAAIVQRKSIQAQHIGSAAVAVVLLSLLSASCLYFLAPAIASYFRIDALEKVIRCLLIVIPITGVALVPESVLQKEMKFRALSLIDIVSFLVGYLCVALPLALTGAGVWALVVANIVQSLSKMCGVLYLGEMPKFWRFDFAALAEMLRFGSGFSIARIGNNLAQQADNIVVGKSLGAESLGIYSRAYSLLVLPANLIGQSILRVSFPALASIATEEERFAQAKLMAISCVCFVSFPLGILIYQSAPIVVKILLGDSWLAVIEPLKILSLALVFRTGYKVLDSVAIAAGAVYRRAWRQWIYAILVYIGALVGQNWGIEGVCWAVSLCVFLNYCLMLQLALSVTNVKLNVILALHARYLFLGCAYAFLLQGVAVLLIDGRNFSEILQLVIMMTISILWFGFLLLFSTTFLDRYGIAAFSALQRSKVFRGRVSD